MQLPEIPIVSAYNNLHNCFNLLAFRSIDNKVYIRFGEYEIVQNHSGINDKFRNEIFAASKCSDSEAYLENYTNIGGAMISGIFVPQSRFFTPNDKKTITIYGASSVYGKANHDLVQRILLESNLFDEVKIE